MTEDRAPRPTLGASLACFREGRVLVARRGRAPNRGLWSLPGGRVEFGETAADAALRELKEETGVTAELIGLADVVETIARGEDGAALGHVVVLAYAGRWLAGEARTGEEAEEVAWVEPGSLAGLETTPGLAAAVARAAELAA